jgi:hypothetical protein
LFGIKLNKLCSIQGVNIIKILRAAFVPVFLRHKIKNLICKYKKAARKRLYQKVAHKMLVKLTQTQQQEKEKA